MRAPRADSYLSRRGNTTTRCRGFPRRAEENKGWSTRKYKFSSREGGGAVYRPISILALCYWEAERREQDRIIAREASADWPRRFRCLCARRDLNWKRGARNVGATLLYCCARRLVRRVWVVGEVLMWIWLMRCGYCARCDVRVKMPMYITVLVRDVTDMPMRSCWISGEILCVVNYFYVNRSWLHNGHLEMD